MSYELNLKDSKINNFSSYILTALVVLTFFSTLYDIIARKYGKEPKKFFSAFSLYTNFNNLMKINNSASAIRCIDGMKVLSAFWIIVGHRKFFSFHNSSHNYAFWERFSSQAIDGYNFGVDTFITCSAILVTQSLMRTFET